MHNTATALSNDNLIQTVQVDVSPDSYIAVFEKEDDFKLLKS